MKLLKDIKNLIIGLGITGKHLGRHAITLQYPEEKMEMPERSRGIVVLLSDHETGELNCTGCLLCAKACPTAAIIIDAPRDENKKRVMRGFSVDNGLCCFCGLCEEACSFSALKMATKYEFSTMTKEDLTWDIHKLQEIGLDVPYEDTRKRKNPARIVSPDWEPPPPAPPKEATTDTKADQAPANPESTQEKTNNDAKEKE